MSTATAVRVDRLGKCYRLGQRGAGYKSLRESLTNAAVAIGRRRGSGERKDTLVWALRDLSFNVPHGEVLGVIGRNGAGKSTLLKILSRITEPTEGEAQVYGRVGSLLEVGTGFHPELTGRENVYLNGAILGMSRVEIERKFDEIVGFAGVEEFIDTPIKRFSTGMQVRLAFAVAAHLDTEILFVDEVLSVGDAEFQKRCLDRMRQVTREGRTVILVSHDMTTIRSLCARVLLLERGRLVLDGPPGSVVGHYLSQSSAAGRAVEREELDQAAIGHIDRADPTVRCTRIEVLDGHGAPRASFQSDEDVLVRIGYRCYRTIPDLRVVLSVVDDNGNAVLTTQTLDDPEAVHFAHLGPGEYRSTVKIPSRLFGERSVRLTLEIINVKTEHLMYAGIVGFDVHFMPYNQVLYGSFSTSPFRPRFSWTTEACEPGKEVDVQRSGA